MRVLAFDSSTQVASVCLYENSIVLASSESKNPKTHSEFVNSAIDQILKNHRIKLKDIDLLAVGIGPGSFTGVRVSANIARAFSYLLEIPFVAFNSLETLSLQVGGRNCLTMINAYKNMVFFAAMIDKQKIISPELIKISDLEKKISDLGLENPIICVGDGYNAYEKYFSQHLKSNLIRNSAYFDFPKAETLAKNSLNKTQSKEWKSLIPLYLRVSAAEENLQSTH